MIRGFLDPNPCSRLGMDRVEVRTHGAWARVTEELGEPTAVATDGPWEVCMSVWPSLYPLPLLFPSADHPSIAA